MLLLLDSWDHYNTPYIGQKWHYTGTGFTVDTTAGTPRTGTGCLKLATTNFSYCSYITDQKIFATVGVAIKLGTLAAHDFLWFMTSGDGVSINPVIGIGTANGYLTIKAGPVYGILGTGTTRLTPNAWMYIELQCTYTNTGNIKVHLNGQPEITYPSGGTADVRYAGTTYLDRVGLGCSIANNTTAGHFYDDFYLCDNGGSLNNANFLGPINVPNLLPTGAGNYTQWNAQATGSPGANYTYMDDPIVDDETTYIEALVTGKIDSYTMADLNTSPTIYGIQTNTVSRRTGPTGPYTPSVLMRIGGTNYTTALYPLDTYTVLTNMYEQVPGTSSNWTAATLNATELGILT